MGRQVYLTKIALGRSAFEPSQTTTQTAEYVQLAFCDDVVGGTGPRSTPADSAVSSQQELPPVTREPNTNRYIQLYDERGNPVNPRAHEHGRRLREAQNDVLASIGLVERRRSPAEDLPGSYAERLQQLDLEDAAGRNIASASSLTETVCTWWIGSLRARILTFRFEHALPFSYIVASERNLSGRTLVNSGFTSDFLHTLSVQTFSYADSILRPLDRLFLSSRASRKTRAVYRRWRNVTKFCFEISLQVLFYPLAYHSCLQRLGLLPARPLLPPVKAFVPFSRWSPLLPFSLQYDACASASGFLKAALTSPFIFLSLQYFCEQWILSTISEAIETGVVHPNNSDMPGGNNDRDWKNPFLDLRSRSPPLIRTAIDRLLAFTGWGESLSLEDMDREPAIQMMHTHRMSEDPTIEIGGQHVTNINRLDFQLAHQEGPMEHSVRNVERLVPPVSALSEMLPPATPSSPPPSPTASHASQNDNDPRIRITSREGIVEMEVRLPHVLSSHTELAGSDTLTPRNEDTASYAPIRTPGTRTHHRVTLLSMAPAQRLGMICKGQIVTWATLPLKLVTLRLVASHYLASRHGYVGPRRVLDVFPGLDELSWSSVGVQMSRIALCGALELAVDLGLWGFQYLAVTYTGATSFGWGTL